MSKNLAIVALVLGISGSALAQTAEVRVSNPPEDAVNVVPVADTIPFIQMVVFGGAEQSYVADLHFEGFVPAGFVFIVDQLAVRMTLPPGQSSMVDLHIGGSAGSPPNQRIPVPLVAEMTFMSSINNPLWTLQSGSTPAHFAVESGRRLAVGVVRSRQAGSSNGYITLQGHLVPLPGPRGQ